MKSNASLTLKSNYDDELTLDIQRDMEEIGKFVRSSFDTVVKFPIFQEVEVRIGAQNLDKNIVKLLTPTHDINRLYLVVFYSTITDLRKQETVYIKWEYHHHDGIIYHMKDYKDVEAIIKMDSLLIN